MISSGSAQGACTVHGCRFRISFKGCIVFKYSVWFRIVCSALPRLGGPLESRLARSVRAVLLVVLKR